MQDNTKTTHLDQNIHGLDIVPVTISVADTAIKPNTEQLIKMVPIANTKHRFI